MTTPDRDTIRKALLETLGKYDRDGFSYKGALEDAAQALGQRQHHSVQARLFEAWDDLCRAGVLSWGINFSNYGPPWARLTQHGTETMKNVAAIPPTLPGTAP